MDHLKIVLSALSLFALCTQLGLATPGQSKTQFLAWAGGNPVLRTLERGHDEMSGGTIYHKMIRVGKLPVYFSAEPGVGELIYQENLAVQGQREGYDMRKHIDVAATILQAVYGKTIADDFRHAHVVGDFAIYQEPERITFYKGARFAYQLSGVQTLIFRLNELPQALKNAKECETMQCGD